MKEIILSYLPKSHPWRQQIHCFDTIDSTNTRAKEMALAGAPHGTVLIADRQTGGRGRMGRCFHSPAGLGVYMSVILRPNCPMEALMHLTCAAAVAACDGVETSAGIRPGIKWTNDLVCGKHKIAGILTELVTAGSEYCAIVGIGINCCQNDSDFPPEIRDMAASLAMVTGKEVCREHVAAALISALQEMDAALLSGKDAMLKRYRESCITLGKDIQLLRSGEIRYGHALSVDENGALEVLFPDGHREFVQSGEVSIRGMYGYSS